MNANNQIDNYPAMQQVSRVPSSIANEPSSQAHWNEGSQHHFADALRHASASAPPRPRAGLRSSDTDSGAKNQSSENVTHNGTASGTEPSTTSIPSPLLDGTPPLDVPGAMTLHGNESDNSTSAPATQSSVVGEPQAAQLLAAADMAMPSPEGHVASAKTGNEASTRLRDQGALSKNSQSFTFHTALPALANGSVLGTSTAPSADIGLPQSSRLDTANRSGTNNPVPTLLVSTAKSGPGEIAVLNKVKLNPGSLIGNPDGSTDMHPPESVAVATPPGPALQSGPRTDSGNSSPSPLTVDLSRPGQPTSIVDAVNQASIPRLQAPEADAARTAASALDSVSQPSATQANSSDPIRTAATGPQTFRSRLSTEVHLSEAGPSTIIGPAFPQTNLNTTDLEHNFSERTSPSTTVGFDRSTPVGFTHDKDAMTNTRAGIEVGFHDDTLGWLSVRASVNHGGEINAVLGSTSQGNAASITGMLPSLNRFLQEHNVPVFSLNSDLHIAPNVNVRTTEHAGAAHQQGTAGNNQGGSAQHSGTAPERQSPGSRTNQTLQENTGPQSSLLSPALNPNQSAASPSDPRTAPSGGWTVPTVSVRI